MIFLKFTDDKEAEKELEAAFGKNSVIDIDGVEVKNKKGDGFFYDIVGYVPDIIEPDTDFPDDETKVKVKKRTDEYADGYHVILLCDIFPENLSPFVISKPAQPYRVFMGHE